MIGVSQKHREALHTYSCAYDDWCVAEGKYPMILYVWRLNINGGTHRFVHIYPSLLHLILGKQNASLPKEKRKKFKLSTEKQKKCESAGPTFGMFSLRHVRMVAVQ